MFVDTSVALQLYDHRCVYSWPLGSTDHMTCPTHFHAAMGKYCAVRNSNVSYIVQCTMYYYYIHVHVRNTHGLYFPEAFDSKSVGYDCTNLKQELLLWVSEEKSLPAPILLPSSPLSLLPPSLPHCLVSVNATGSVTMLTVEGECVQVIGEVVIGGRRTRRRQLQ